MKEKCQDCDYVLPSGDCVLNRDPTKCVSSDVRQGVFFSKNAFVMIFSRNLFLIILAVSAILIIGGAGAWYSFQPSFCNRCHEMKKDFSTWEASAHRNINCLSCHVEPGLVHLFIDKIKASKSLYYHLTGRYEKPINKENELASEISSESCLQCHTLERQMSYSSGLKMNHAAHMKIRMRCSECHNRVAHELSSYQNLATMGSCQERCHNGKALSNDCSLCHIQSFLRKAKK